jgi:hypothetical protein
LPPGVVGPLGDGRATRKRPSVHTIFVRRSSVRGALTVFQVFVSETVDIRSLLVPVHGT